MSCSNRMVGWTLARVFRLNMSKHRFMSLLNAIAYKYDPTARTKTLEPSASIFESIAYSIAVAIKNPSGFFQSNGSLRMTNQITLSFRKIRPQFLCITHHIGNGNSKAAVPKSVVK